MAAVGDASAMYAMHERVGVGSFGTVYRATAMCGGQVAIKVIDVESEAELQEVRAEIATLATVECAQLVRYLGSYVVQNQLWIVTEYLEGGSLCDIMTTLGCAFDEATIAGVAVSLVQALVYLHAQRKLHRDVKAKNILVSLQGEVKLADFGVATQLTDTTTKRQSLVGTPYWMAPEVITQARYADKADVWSTGITLIELATRSPPHASLHPMKVLFVVPKDDAPRLTGPFSPAFKAFVQRCLHKDSSMRPSAKELESDPFLTAADASAAQAQLCVLARRRIEMNGSVGAGLAAATRSLRATQVSEVRCHRI